MAQQSVKSRRITALDFTKGMLVLIMVLYHWINYFLGPQDNRYLRFLTPSFIFISGFIISNVYFSKYGIADRHLPMRLIQRGLKILGVFLALNLMRTLADLRHPIESASSTSSWATRFWAIYIFGNGVGGGQSKAVAFFILVPISYLLILCAPLLIASRFFKYTFHAACLISLVLIGIASYQDMDIPNLQLLAIGLLGVLAGYVPITKVDAFVRHPYILIAGYTAYLAAITIWNVIYPLQIIGVYLSLMIIYLVGLDDGSPSKIRATINLLGRYSLLGYIAQIAILQLLRLGLNHIDSETFVLVSSFVMAFGFTITCIWMVDIARARFAQIDWAYRVVFG